MERGMIGGKWLITEPNNVRCISTSIRGRKYKSNGRIRDRSVKMRDILYHLSLLCLAPLPQYLLITYFIQNMLQLFVGVATYRRCWHSKKHLSMVPYNFQKQVFVQRQCILPKLHHIYSFYLISFSDRKGIFLRPSLLYYIMHEQQNPM